MDCVVTPLKTLMGFPVHLNVQLKFYNLSNLKRGWQYQHWSYQSLLRQHEITQSMSRKGNCLDNAPAESFFNLLKRECLKQIKITSFQQFKMVIDQYIHWYNSTRISVNKKGMTPNEYIRYHSNL